MTDETKETTVPLKWTDPRCATCDADLDTGGHYAGCGNADRYDGEAPVRWFTCTGPCCTNQLDLPHVERHGQVCDRCLEAEERELHETGVELGWW